MGHPRVEKLRSDISRKCEITVTWTRTLARREFFDVPRTILESRSDRVR